MRNATEAITESELPGVWLEHRRGCKHCKQYVEGSTATLAFVCAEGAPLIKRLLEIEHRPEVQAKRRAERRAYQESEVGKHKTTADKLRKAMRYK